MSKLINTKETEFLTFDTYKQDNKKTYDIDVFSKDDELIGSIYWKSTWRKYVFEPVDSILYIIESVLKASHQLKDQP